MTITNALNWWARETPDRMAVNIDGVSLTYSELRDWARGVGSGLSAQGVKAGDRVGILGSQALSYLALALGLQFIGAVAVPLNTRFTARELRTALEDTTPVMVFSDAERFALAERTLADSGLASLRPIESVEAFRSGTPVEIDHHPDRADLIAIMSTSGSTAKPKFVKFTHDMVVSIALELQLIEPTTRQGRTLILSPFFTGGLYVVFEYVVLGCSQFIRSRAEGDDLIDLLERERITVLPAPPVFFERIAATAHFPDADLSALTWAVVGGARVSESLVKAYREKGVLLRCLFGQTEAGGSWAATGSALENPLQAGFGGPFTDWRTIRDGQFLGHGEAGEIVIRGPSVTPGYWENPEATAQILQDGWLRTGDLGSVDEAGSLTFLDRLKDIIISGGLNISAAEVEHVVSEVDGVEEVAVIAAADAKFGETPLAVIHAARSIDPETVVAHCNQNLSNYKVPRYVVQHDGPLPRLPSGKISKPALREFYKDAHSVLTKVR